MKVNFYDEIRQMITQEFGMNSEELKKLVEEQMRQVIKSIAERVVQKGIGETQEEILKRIIHSEVSQAMRSYNIKNLIEERVEKEIKEQFYFSVKRREDM